MYTDHSQGTLEMTNDRFNFAIQGPGFFEIETPEGTRYTRNGSFSRNEEGELITANGHRVLGDGGPITLPAGDLIVGEQGDISVDGVGQGRLRIVRFANPQGLVPIGRSLYRADVAPEEAPDSLVRQGFLEGANFDLVNEMVHMMTTFRYFETAQKAVQIQDETLDRAVNQVGRVQRS